MCECGHVFHVKHFCEVGVKSQRTPTHFSYILLVYKNADEYFDGLILIVYIFLPILQQSELDFDA